MTVLSTRAVAALLERRVRQGGTLHLQAAVRWLRDELHVPEHRARAGIAQALDRGHLYLAGGNEPTLTAAEVIA